MDDLDKQLAELQMLNNTELPPNPTLQRPSVTAGKKVGPVVPPKPKKPQPQNFDHQMTQSSSPVELEVNHVETGVSTTLTSTIGYPALKPDDDYCPIDEISLGNPPTRKIHEANAAIQVMSKEFGYCLKDEVPKLCVAENQSAANPEYQGSIPDENFRFISEQNVKTFSLEDAENLREFLDGIGRQKGDQNFKILKLTCANVKTSLDLMLEEWFSSGFNRATHWFFTIIQIEGLFEDITIENLRIFQTDLGRSKPVILQWKFSSSSKNFVFYKRSNETQLNSLGELKETKLTEEELIEELTPEGNFSLPLLLKALLHGLGGYFSGDLPRTAFDVAREFDGWRLIDYAARDDDDLSLRFLRLVEWDLAAISGEQRVLEIAAKYSGPRSISALLDQPMIGSVGEPWLSEEQKNLLELADISNNTPLTIAVEEGRTDALEYLIICGADINYRKKVRWNYFTPIQTAWENKFYDKVIALLEADSPFPDEYQLDDLSDTDIVVNLRKLTEIRKIFHRSIIDKDEGKVKDFIRDYPRLRYGYDCKNQTALLTALKAGEYEMFALLESNKFAISNGEKQDFLALMEGLSEQQKDELKQAKLRYFGKEKNSHITYLLSKWRKHGAGSEDHTRIVRELFERLDEIPEISTVLKVLEHAEALEIIFDFNKDSIVDLDPTKSSATSGSCDYKVGRLYVGAKQPLEALGTLAHELTHLAMQTVFDNDCNPYTTSEESVKSQFGEIVEEYRDRKAMDNIIARVFTVYTNPKDWPSELIVRVPHLLAVHHQQKDDPQVLEKLWKEAPELFSFYHENIQKRFEEFIRDPNRCKAQIKLWRLNDLLGQLQAIEESKIWLDSSRLLKEHEIDFSTILIISSNLPQLTKIDLYQALIRKEGDLRNRFVFTTVEHFKNDKQAREIYDSFQSPIKPILIVDCSRDYRLHYRYLWGTIEGFREKARIVFIADSAIADLIQNNSGNSQTKSIRRDYIWSDLLLESQHLLLENSVDFQGYPIALNKLIKYDSALIQFIPLQDLLQGTQIKVGKPLSISYGYDERFYIERSLKKWSDDAHQFRSYQTEPPIVSVEQLYQQKLVLIADGAGMGKSTLLTHFSKKIKEQNLDYWVLKYDLNNHTDLLEEQQKKKLRPLHFLRQKLLQFQTQFEEVLFEHSLDDKKIVLMLDGFDEISPRFKQVVLELVEAFHASPIGQLWIATRPHLKGDLERALDGASYFLQPFSVENQVKFLTRFWSNIVAGDSQILNCDRIEKYALELVGRLSKSIKDNEKQLTGVPLQTRMLGEAFDEEFKDFYYSNHSEPNLPKQLDILEVYEKFLDRKYLIYVSEKNNAAKINVATKDLVDILKGGVNLRKIHQQLALESLFPKQKQNLLQLRKKHILPPEKLNRIGLVDYAGGKPRFIHRTFSEYYVMDFLACELGKSNQPYLRDFLLKQILLVADHEVMRSFFDGMLRKIMSCIKSETFSWYGQRIDELWTQGLLRNSEGTILHNAVGEGNPNIITFMLEALKGVEQNKSTLKEMFSARNNEQYNLTVWHISAWRDNSFIIPKLREWSKEAGLTHEEFKKIFLSRGKDIWTILHPAVYMGYDKTSKEFFRLAGEVLTKQEFKSFLLSGDKFGQTPWGLCASSSKDGFFTNILTLASEVLDLGDFKDILLALDVHHETPWHKVGSEGDLKAFNWLFSWSKTQLTADDIKKAFLKPFSLWPSLAGRNSVEMLEKFRKWSEDIKLDFIDDVLLSRDKYLEQAWHRAAEKGDVMILQKLVQFCQDFDINLADHLVLSKTKFGRTTWQTAAMYGRANILEYLLGISKNLNLDLKNDLLLHKGQGGVNSWHLSASSGDVQSMKIIWNLAKDLRVNVKGELLLSEDKDGKTAWFLSCDQGRYEAMVMLWKISQKLLDLYELKSLLQSKDRSGKYLLHRIEMFSFTDLFEKYWEYGQTVFDPDDFEEFFLSKDKYGKNVWHRIAHAGNVESLEVLWKLCGEIKPKMSDRKKLLLRKDNYGATPFYHAAHNGKRKALEKLWEFAKTADFTSGELKSLILDRGTNGESAWHQIYLGIIEMLWDLALEIGMDVKRELLMQKGFRDRTLWHKAAFHGASNVLEKLYELGGSIGLTPEEYRLMFLEKDSEGKSVWHVASESAFHGVLETLKKFCIELAIKMKEDILLTKDNDGNTIWHSLAQKTYITTTEKLHRFISEEDLTPTEFKNLLLSKNNAGDTVWHLTAQSRYPDYLKNLWRLAEASKLSQEDFEELLHNQDHLGNTVWHKILKSKKIPELEDFFVWGIEVLDPMGLKHLLTLTDTDSKTIWHVSAELGLLETIKVILSHSKSKLDDQSIRGTMEMAEFYRRSPLSLAVAGGHLQTVKFLLEIGTDAFARKCYDGILKQAILAGQQDITSVILDEIQRRSLS